MYGCREPTLQQLQTRLTHMYGCREPTLQQLQTWLTHLYGWIRARVQWWNMEWDMVYSTMEVVE